MQRKYAIQRSLPNIQGSCQWYAASVVNNLGNYRTLLEKEFHVYPVLNPEMKFIDKKAPKKPRKARIEVQSNRITLVWDAPKAKKEMDKAKQFVIYLFEPNEKIDLNNPTKIQAVSHKQNFELKGNLMGHTIVITALDRMHNESKGVKIKL
jgi:hypothetical protein